MSHWMIPLVSNVVFMTPFSRFLQFSIFVIHNCEFMPTNRFMNFVVACMELLPADVHCIVACVEIRSTSLRLYVHWARLRLTRRGWRHVLYLRAFLNISNSKLKECDKFSSIFWHCRASFFSFAQCCFSLIGSELLEALYFLLFLLARTHSSLPSQNLQDQIWRFLLLDEHRCVLPLFRVLADDWVCKLLICSWQLYHSICAWENEFVSFFHNDHFFRCDVLVIPLLLLREYLCFPASPARSAHPICMFGRTSLSNWRRLVLFSGVMNWYSTFCSKPNLRS